MAAIMFSVKTVLEIISHHWLDANISLTGRCRGPAILDEDGVIHSDDPAAN